MQDCHAECSPDSVPARKLPPEPDELILLLRPLRTEHVEEYLCGSGTLVSEVKASMAERHNNDAGFFDQG